MKKWIAIALAVSCVLVLSACGGNVKNVQITDYHSEIFTDAEIKSAIDVILSYFRMNFSGCTLKEITYLGDEKLSEYQELADRYNADEAIVLVSTYDVDASGGDGSLEPNGTYKDWTWVLVRTDNGKWQHVDHGY